MKEFVCLSITQNSQSKGDGQVMHVERIIRKGTLYGLHEFQKITGIGRAGMRAMRNKGLRVLRIGKREFVSGDDFFNFLQKQNSNQNMEN